MTATHDTPAPPLTLARGEYVTATPDNEWLLAVDPREPDKGFNAYRWTVYQASNVSNSRAGYCATKADAVNDANVALNSLRDDTARGIA